MHCQEGKDSNIESSSKNRAENKNKCKKNKYQINTQPFIGQQVDLA